jgi:hypothetical protein
LNRKLHVCFVCGHARRPATNANMDFRFWREDATLLEQQNVQQVNRPLPRPSRRSIRRYCTDASARTISLFRQANLQSFRRRRRRRRDTRMEDHMNEVTDQLSRRRTFTYGRHDDCDDPIRAPRPSPAPYKPTRTRRLNHVISSCCGITDNIYMLYKGAALYRTRGLFSANVPWSC